MCARIYLVNKLELLLDGARSHVYKEEDKFHEDLYLKNYNMDLYKKLGYVGGIILPSTT